MLYYSYKDNLGRQIIANSWKRPYFMDDTEIKVYIKDDAGNYKSPTKDEWIKESMKESDTRNVGRIGEEAVFNASKFSQCTTAD